MLPHTDFSASITAQHRLHELIPGGAHTYARASDQYPEYMPPVLVRGDGAQVWDVDGNRYVEYGMGLRAVTLGHCHPTVTAAVTEALQQGVSFSRPSVWELRAAEQLHALVPSAEMVKFAKNGSDVTTAAVKLARAATSRQDVLLADHPFHSVDDWFIGLTPMNAGIPDSQYSGTHQIAYNDLDAAATALRTRRYACLMLEPATANAEPAAGYLAGLQQLCRETGTVLIFDEIITGFRWSACGAQAVYGVTPDLSCFGKAMGNGFAIAALTGRRELMELGGLNTDQARAFLLSTTNGPETTGLAAFCAVAEVYADDAPVRIMESQGEALRAGLEEVTARHGVQDQIRILGRPSCMVFTSLDHSGTPSQPFRTLLLQELLRYGVLGQSLVISAAHTDADLETTITAFDHAAAVYARALDQQSVTGLLHGRPVAPALRSRAAPRRL